MKTKIVYALTSDNSDIYLEQTYISVYSLRKYHPDAYVVLVVDDNTDKTITGKREYILKIITEKVVVVPPCGYSKVERSRYLKTTLRNKIEGDYLFIDSDTVVTESLDEVDSFSCDICAVLDSHVTLDYHSKFNSLIKGQAYSIGWDMTEKDFNYFNSGVMYVKDSEISHNFYTRWNEEWTKGKNNLISPLPSDQPSLGKVNAEFGYIIKEMNGTWNCQVATNGLCFFENAKILHYFSSTIQRGEKDNVYSLMNVKVFKSFKETGVVDDELKSMIDNPKTLFAKKLILLSGETLEVYQSSLVNYVYVLYRKYRKIYNLFNKILLMYGNRNK